MSALLEKRYLIAVIAGAIASLINLLTSLGTFSSIPDFLSYILGGILIITWIVAVVSSFGRIWKLTKLPFSGLGIFSILHIPLFAIFIAVSGMIFCVCLIFPIIPTGIAYFMD